MLSSEELVDIWEAPPAGCRPQLKTDLTERHLVHKWPFGGCGGARERFPGQAGLGHVIEHPPEGS